MPSVPLIDYRLDSIFGFRASPPFQSFDISRGTASPKPFSEIEAVAELTCADFENLIKFLEEESDALRLITDRHTLDSQTDKVDCGKRQVAAADRRLFAEAVLEYACAASHSSHLILVSLGVVGSISHVG